MYTTKEGDGGDILLNVFIENFIKIHQSVWSEALPHTDKHTHTHTHTYTHKHTHTHTNYASNTSSLTLTSLQSYQIFYRPIVKIEYCV